jgi:hypothetical protein
MESNNMTQEEKAKAYDEALALAKRLISNNYTEVEKLCLECVLPELKESEDEKIRKNLITCISTLKHPLFSERERKEFLAWLEKQGEQKSIDNLTPQDAMDIAVAKCFEQGKQKSADIVEPKFKVGDWVVRGKTIAQILDVQEQYYVGLDIDGNDFTSSRFLSDDKIHLWTIQDAKDGDVLTYRDGKWIFIYKEKIDNNSFYYHALYSTIHQDLTINDAGFPLLDDTTTPATKEQRDLLFSKMKEAGYEWNAKKKELKKEKD